jgi:restriction system protein
MATASEYEDFIYRVCEALGEPDGIVVYRNKTYTGRVSRRQITMEVSFEGQLLGARILGLVACKCYKSRVEVSDVEEFHSKLDDIGAHKGIMFTTVGYEAGAKKVAKDEASRSSFCGKVSSRASAEWRRKRRNGPPRQTS